MNSQLQDQQFRLPRKIVIHLNTTLKNMSDVQGEGMKRLRRLVDEKVMTYQQLKRLIYDFKRLDPVEDEQSFNLNGGQVMFDWANETLNKARKEVEQQKKSKQRASDLTPGMGNAYRKTHEKDGTGGSVDISRLSESIKRIDKLIRR